MHRAKAGPTKKRATAILARIRGGAAGREDRPKKGPRGPASALHGAATCPREPGGYCGARDDVLVVSTRRNTATACFISSMVPSVMRVCDFS